MLVSPALHSRSTACAHDSPSHAGRKGHGEIRPVRSSGTAGSEIRILIVEDDPDARYLYDSMLTRAGSLVDTADNGRDGLDSARAQLTDLIVMDINLPVMGGWEAIELLRTSPSTRDIPVCVASAGLSDASQARAESLDCEALFSKPLTPSELLAGITQILGVRDRDR